MMKTTGRRKRENSAQKMDKTIAARYMSGERPIEIAESMHISFSEFKRRLEKAMEYGLLDRR